ncbi:hypothetical protein HanHA300_Chr14g0511141 [Helianthus annuus]|nr:hypothetical protein HanHA300_Chr14g0511141 [Helianthus annuus]KAJ0466890.1 hypothetical protein HanIR_Chr14g0677151 [Helianthus annuus]
MTLVGLEYLNPEEPETLIVELWENPGPTDPENEKFHGEMVVGNMMIELVYKPFGEEVSATRKATVGTRVYEGKDLEGKHHTNPSVRILFNGEEKNTKVCFHICMQSGLW